MSDETEDNILDSEILHYIVKGIDSSVALQKSERLARKVMVELIKAGRSEFLLLRDDEVSGWWGKIVNGINDKIAKHKERVRLYEIKIAAYDRLTPAERKILGIRKPAKPRGLK